MKNKNAQVKNFSTSSGLKSQILCFRSEQFLHHSFFLIFRDNIMLIKILTSIFLLAIFYNTSGAFVISGKVTTTADKAVQYAKVRFVPQNDTSVFYSAITDSSGNYVITITGVSEPVSAAESFQLHQNYPNPFSEQTTIAYQLQRQSPVVISIYNILGQRIRTFHIENTGHEVGHVQWDGGDEFEKKVASGIYFYVMSVGEKRQGRKMLFIEDMMIGSGSTFPMRQIQNYRQGMNFIYTEGLYQAIANIYTVCIENTDSTQPRIEPVKGDKVTILQDTVLNFKVLDATPCVWHYLGLGNESVESIAVHPNNPDIIYAGTGYDFSAGHFGKLFKTTNGGRSWDILMVGQPLFFFLDIEIDPVHPETVYTTPLPVLKSTNGGKTWFDISNGIKIDWETRVSSIVIDPNNTNVLYVGTGGFFGGRFYKSTNGGENWRDLTNDGRLRNGVWSIAMDPNNSNILYAGTAFSGDLLKTTDAGETWILTGLRETAQMIYDILIHPFNTQIIYAGISEMGIWKTDNGSTTWIPYNDGLIDSLKSAIRIIIRTVSSELFLVNASRNYIDAGIFKRANDNEPWVKIGINSMGDYAYCDLKLSINEMILYFGGSKGLYYYKLK